VIFVSRIAVFAEYVAIVMAAPWLMYSLFTMVKRLWVYQFDRHGIYGSDWHMLRYFLSTGKKSYIFVDYEIQSTLSWDDIHRIVLPKLEALLQQAQSPLSVSLDLQKRRLVFKDTPQLDDVLEYHDQFNAFYKIGDYHQRDCVIRFFPSQRRVGILFDHTVFDGILLSQQICQPILDFRPFSKGMLQEDRYFPLLSETLQYYTLMKLAISQCRVKSLPRRIDQPQSVVHHNWEFDQVKNIKSTFRCTFPDALLAYYIDHVFKCLDIQYSSLRVGIVVGFKNPRFRNNYSVCRVNISRATDISDYVSQIVDQVKKNQHEVLPLYQVFSIHDLQSRFKSGLIDCLFSPLFFFPKKGLSQHMQQTRFFNVPSGCPLYVFANAFGDRVYCSTTINTTALDEEKFSSGGAMFKFDETYSEVIGNALEMAVNPSAVEV